MSRSAQQSLRFWNRYARKYATRPIENMERYQQKLAMTQEYFTPASKVLEFGCGTGSTALIHAPYVQSVLATDSAPSMIDIANGKLVEGGDGEGIENVSFRACTLFDIPKEEGPFDVILGLNVLHLMEDMDEAIARSYELLKPGGVFVTSTACLTEGGGFLWRMILPVGAMLGAIPHVKFFDVASLLDRIEGAGFTIVRRMLPEPGEKGCFLIAQK